MLSYSSKQTYRKLTDLPDSLRPALRQSLAYILEAQEPSVVDQRIHKELRKLSKLAGVTITKDLLIQLYKEEQGQAPIPPLTDERLRRLRLKPMRSQSGIQTVAVLTKPFPCPGQCIFCPNDVRMPKSYIASEPGAQRAERNSFDPYLQTYSRLQALKNMGHQPSKIELIILGGTWSYYPESYQIWFVHECFRALNDFSHQRDDCDTVRSQIKQSVMSAHRQANRVVDSEEIALDGANLQHNYNQVISQHYLQPEILQEGGLEVRREQKSWEELQQQHIENETAACRSVGLMIETRPDNISLAEILRLRRLGCTKTQIGFQSLNDEVLDLNKRGHDVAATKRAVALLRQAGFKIHAHWMPNLYGSDVTKDRDEFIKLFTDDAFKPDELKIYPCALIPSAELMAYYQRGEWQPYTTAELEQLLAFCLTHTPPWARLTRVVRDIPDQETATDHLPTNLRQLVEEQLRTQPQTKLQDIRAREIRNRQPELPIKLETLRYTTSTGQECFLQYVDQAGYLLGFLRLSLPTEPSQVEELGQSAIIRELHVYGQVAPYGNKTKTQHQGLGTKLLREAKRLAQMQGYTNLAVISAVGTRGYYRKLHFQDKELYQHLPLTTL